MTEGLCSETERVLLTFIYPFFIFTFLERKGVHWEAEHDPCSGKSSVLMSSQKN